jgi:Rod binding domain-containing protein
MAKHESSLQQAKALSSQGPKDAAAIEEAAGGFEALLLHNMLKAMWETVEFTGFMGGDSNEAQIYRDMLNQAIADSVVEGKGIGVKDFLTKEIAKAENASNNKEGKSN